MSHWSYAIKPCLKCCMLPGCVSRLVGLTMSDISLRQGVVRVIGKGNKERLVPLGKRWFTGWKPNLEHGRPWSAEWCVN